MKIKSSLKDYDRWSVANKPEAFSPLDYIHGVVKLNHLKIDLAFSFSELFWPSFFETDGFVFLKEFYNPERLNKLVTAGHSRSDIQHWMNLIILDDIFEDDQRHLTIVLCQNIAKMWRSKLSQDFPQNVFVVEEFVNEDDDIGLTFFIK